ncbi:hypothetical protein WJX72_010983 [[Myrmecia] bisecta]|uniref:DUF202 domain-containing protein n=1 Tax=[Myrmecia] bisecta TaxID=41462 RepID=A0AAW1QC48_9CHLO
MAHISDVLFGTSLSTPGARLQLPRKVPLRIEPKTYFANERTFLAWLHMAVTMGGITTALVSFAVEEQNKAGSGSRAVSAWTTKLIGCLLLPMSVIITAYALFTFINRSRNIEKKQMGFYHDQFGPVILAGLVLLSLLIILVTSIIDFATLP